MNSELLGNQEIESMLGTYWENFTRWADTKSVSTLDIPPKILPVFIPRRLLELAYDPHKIKAILYPHSRYPTSLDFMIYEEDRHPNPDLLVNLAKSKRSIHEIKSQNLLLGTADIDQMDFDLWEDRQGYEFGLKPSDISYIQYGIQFSLKKPECAYTSYYQDRRSMQGRGIGTSFYNRLEAVLKRLGFNYLAGDVTSNHPDFFRKTRTQFDELQPEIQEKILRPYAENLGEFLVKIL